MSLYKGDNLISGHNILYSTTGQNTDGAMTQKAVSDITENTRFDGQWVASLSTLLNNVSLNATTYLDIDLSNYLPNDDYEYLVEISWSVYGAAFARMVFNTSFGFYTVNTHTTSTANYYTDGCNKIVVGKDRIVRVRRSGGWNDTATVSALGYRRIGTNT